MTGAAAVQPTAHDAIAPMPGIEVRGLSRRYGKLRALDDVSFSVPKGSLCALIGPNGAGKTTLLSILATLDDEFDGVARIAGQDVASAPLDVRRQLGFVPDHAGLYANLNVAEYLEFFATDGESPTGHRDEVLAMLEQKDNLLVAFPSQTFHGVTGVQCDSDDFADGRFVVVGFLGPQ